MSVLSFEVFKARFGAMGLVEVVPAWGKGWNKMGFKVHSGILNEHLSYSQTL